MLAAGRQEEAIIDPEPTPDAAQEHVAELSPLEGHEPPVIGDVVAVVAAEDEPAVVEACVSTSIQVRAASAGPSAPASSSPPAESVDLSVVATMLWEGVSAFGDADSALRGVEVRGLNLLVRLVLGASCIYCVH